MMEEFITKHQDFFDDLLCDTWLCDTPISVECVKATWYFCVKNGLESIPEDKFEEHFDITFQDIADYWNKEVLKVC